MGSRGGVPRRTLGGPQLSTAKVEKMRRWWLQGVSVGKGAAMRSEDPQPALRGVTVPAASSGV